MTFRHLSFCRLRERKEKIKYMGERPASRSTQSVLGRPAASASPATLLEMRILNSTADLLNLHPWEAQEYVFYLISSLGDL